MAVSSNYYKNRETDIVTWVDDHDRIGVMRFTFDGKKFYNLFADYPWALSKREKEIFDRENPYWAKFLGNRKKG